MFFPAHGATIDLLNGDDHARFITKGSRKARERCAKDVSTRAMSCPKFTKLFVSARKMKAQALLQGKRATYHNGILVVSTFIRIDNSRFVVEFVTEFV